MPGPNNERCDYCYFFEEYSCKRYPPNLENDRIGCASVNKHHWCGEFLFCDGLDKEG